MNVQLQDRIAIRRRLSDAAETLDAENERKARALLAATRKFADMVSLLGHQRRWLALQCIRMMSKGQLEASIPILQSEFDDVDRTSNIERWMEVGTALTYALSRRATL